MKERRSIRKFKSELPSKANLEQIVEAGLYAANGMEKQATKIIVITDKKLRDKIMEMNRKIGGWDQGFDPFYGAPAMLIVLAEKKLAKQNLRRLTCYGKSYAGSSFTLSWKHMDSPRKRRVRK